MNPLGSKGLYFLRLLQRWRPSKSSKLPQPEADVIVEGSAWMLREEGNGVFYNKVQEFNRDMSVMVIRNFVRERLMENAKKAVLRQRKIHKQTPTDSDFKDLDYNSNWAQEAEESSRNKGIRILDAMAASALRSIRYAKEIPGVKEVIVNDIDLAAVEAAKQNIINNNVPDGRIRVQHSDALAVMYDTLKPGVERYDVIDLDPYGSVAPFIDAAVQSIRSGGLLCMTSVDMAVLAGGNTEACYAKYGTMPTKGKYLHEMALRMLLHTIGTCASRYKRSIVPVLSMSVDFYVRLFLRVYDSPREAGLSSSCHSYVLQSTGCPSYWLQPISREVRGKLKSAVLELSTCPITGSRLKFGGPIWSAPMHCMKSVEQILKMLENESWGIGPAPVTKNRIKGVLTAVSEELHDIPLFVTLPDLCATLHCRSPRIGQVRAALIHAGYRVSASHRDPDAIKTDAPPEFIWDIMRCWIKMHPINDMRIKPGSVVATILGTSPEHEVNFEIPSSWHKVKSIARWPQNPEPNWGPGKIQTARKKSIGAGSQGNKRRKYHDEFKSGKLDGKGDLTQNM
eukprot:124664_1